MSILIKGVEMPETCMRCDFLRFYNVYCCGLLLKNIYSGKRREDCPLVDVPPHGRLIDADALHFSRIRIAHNDGTIGGYNAVVMSAEIKDAPTIIEAEEKT